MKTLEERMNELEDLVTREQKKVLDMNDVCAYTGYSKSFLYKLTATGKIPHYKPEGKQLYFDKEEIDAWLLRNPVRPEEPKPPVGVTTLLLSYPEEQVINEVAEWVRRTGNEAKMCRQIFSEDPSGVSI